MTTQKGRRPEGSFKLINIFPVATLEMSQSSSLQTRASSPINGLRKFERRFGSSFLCQGWSSATAMAEAAKPASCASVWVFLQQSCDTDPRHHPRDDILPAVGEAILQPQPLTEGKIFSSRLEKALAGITADTTSPCSPEILLSFPEEILAPSHQIKLGAGKAL